MNAEIYMLVIYDEAMTYLLYIICMTVPLIIFKLQFVFLKKTRTNCYVNFHKAIL